MKKTYKFLLIFLSALCGCSLKYGTPSYDEQNVPEFSFDDVKFNRFEDGNISMSLEAAGIEQYTDDGVGTASENELTKDESVLEPPAQIESSGEENAQ